MICAVGEEQKSDCTPGVIVVNKADVLASPFPSDLLHYLGEKPRIRKQS